MANKFLLALDAGHGLPTPGRRIPANPDPSQHQEWWLNQRICNYIAEAAKQYEGLDTIRVDDTTGAEDVGMSVRCQRANAASADLYYSAHHNAGINGGRGGGVVAFSLGEGTTAAGWRDALYAAIVAAGGLAGNRSSPKTTADFYVLRNTAMPAVLIEHGFMDAPDDAPTILREDYAKAVGYAVAECIASRVGLAKKAQAATPAPEAVVTAEQVQQIAKGEASAAVSGLMSGAGSGDKHNAYADAATTWAKETGLIQGIGNGDYAWTKPMTRQEMVTLLYRYHQWANK